MKVEKRDYGFCVFGSIADAVSWYRETFGDNPVAAFPTIDGRGILREIDSFGAYTSDLIVSFDNWSPETPSR